MNIETKHNEIFKKQYESKYFSPGRVNIIGEHIDYNGGFVMPCALTLGTYASVSKREDGKVMLYSNNFENIGIIELDIQNIEYNEKYDWANYALGMFKMLKEFGNDVSQGLNILIEGTIPNGSGLSSSASLELLIGEIISKENNFEIDRVELIKLAQKCENEFIGVNCGIMDQFAIGMGKENKAIMLDCNTLHFRYADFVLDGVTIVIGNTNKRRELADSKYNERRGECESALAKLKEHYEIEQLCELKNADIAEVEKYLTPTEFKRVRHSISENERVLEAYHELNANEIENLAKLLNESHNSLRDDYEVTGIELDTLVDAVMENGALGARMTGAGFGGCIVSLVKNEDVEKLIESSIKYYEDKIGYKPEFYLGLPGEGTHKIDEQIKY